MLNPGSKKIRDGDPEGEKIMGWIKGWFPENFEKIKGLLNPERFFLSLKSGTECIIHWLISLYLYRDPMRDGGKIRTPSINSNPEYQLISRVAPSQLKKPRVRSVDTRGWSWYEGFVLPPSRIRGPGIDITTFPQSKFLLTFTFIFFVNSHHDITKIGAFKWVVKLVKWDTKMGREIYIAQFSDQK